MEEIFMDRTECRAELELIGYHLDVYKMSEYLDLPIIKDRAPGDYSFVTDEGVVVKNDTKSNLNRWHYQTQQKSMEANDAITELRLALIDAMSGLMEILKSDTTIKVSLYVVIYNTKTQFPTLYIDAENILFAAKLGASVDFDIY